MTKQSTEKFWISTLHAGFLGETTSELEGVGGVPSVEEWVPLRTGSIEGGEHPCIASVSSFWNRDILSLEYQTGGRLIHFFKFVFIWLCLSCSMWDLVP